MAITINNCKTCKKVNAIGIYTMDGDFFDESDNKDEFFFVVRCLECEKDSFSIQSVGDDAVEAIENWNEANREEL
jgi:hypothetical protein